MNKQYVTYGIIGIVAGLILGFFVGNSMSAGGAGAPSATNTNQTSASVNSSGGSTAQLPEGHPPVTPGQTTPARPLTEQEMSGANPSTPTSPPSSPPTTSASASGHFPSLQPLAASSKEERAEKRYKNIQLLKGVAADNIMPIMNSFRTALGVACNYCHVSNSPDDAHKDDNPKKQIARNMIKLMRETNAKFFNGAQTVNCNTCHQGRAKPQQ
jgi:Photosynthetic reaction centre cytochrome C subunit